METRPSQTWLFFLGINAPAFSLAMLHIINNPNIYHYVLTSFIKIDLLPENRLNTALGALSILGLITASIAQPSIGVLSDRTQSRSGTRSPYLIAGSAAVLVTLLVMVNATSWLILILMVIIVQIALNTVQSPMQAFIPDYVVPSRMGFAASIKTILELVGIIVSGIIVVLFLGNNTRPELAVISGSLILFGSVWISLRILPKRSSNPTLRRSDLYDRYMQRFASDNKSQISARWGFTWQSMREIVRQPPLLWWLLGRFFFYASFNTIGKFAITYVTDVFGYTGEEARALQGVVLLVIGSLIFATTVFAGLLSDRMGRRRLATMGGTISAGAALFLTLSPGLTLAIVLICIVGIGSGIFFSAGWALLTYIVPIRKAAFYLGFMNLATTLGGAFGMLGGYMVDRINDAAANPVTGYTVLFAIAAVFFGLGAASTSRVQDDHNYRIA